MDQEKLTAELRRAGYRDNEIDEAIRLMNWFRDELEAVRKFHAEAMRERVAALKKFSDELLAVFEPLRRLGSSQ
jgi:uncharacterized protein Smg (DUF494 family)